MVSRQLVVLVGGKGTRLGDLTKSTPKPLMQITDRDVFLDYFLAAAARQGFREIIMIAGHLGDQVQSRYNHMRFGEADISVLVEPEPLGTGGAFVFARDHLASSFVAANGDTLFDINIRALDAHLHAHSDIKGAIALREVDDAGRYGSVTTDANGRIRQFNEKTKSAEGKAGLINGGIYALRREVIDELSTLPASIETDLFPKLAEKGQLGSVTSKGYFLDIGLPETLATARKELPERQRSALFLDRDGVLNHDINYLHRFEDWVWVEGAIETIKAANDMGKAVIVVTNQAGVGRGYYEEADVWKLHAQVQAELSRHGAFVDAFYYSPHHKDAEGGPYRISNPLDRKPNPGMILRAARQHNIDLTRSCLIGDNKTDIEAAQKAGIKGYLFEGGNLYDMAHSLPEFAAAI